MAKHEPLKVKVEPTKELFVYILTRDIAPLPARGRTRPWALRRPEGRTTLGSAGTAAVSGPDPGAGGGGTAAARPFAPPGRGKRPGIALRNGSGDLSFFH